MIKRRQVLVAGGAAASLAAAGLPRPAIAAASKTTLRFVPQAALANRGPDLDDGHGRHQSRLHGL